MNLEPAASLAQMKRLSVAYITVEDPRNKKSWSGTNFYLMKTVEKYVGEVHLIAPLSAEPWWTLCGILNFFSLRLLGKRYNYRDSKVISRAYAKKIARVLNHIHADVIIAPAGTATTALLETDIPIVYINDRCVAGALDYHEILTNLFLFSKKESIDIEGMAIRKSILTIYSSDWAAKAARQTYSDFHKKIFNVPFGANLDSVPELSQYQSFNKRLKLLFVGVNWEAKGGGIAFETLLYLLENEVDSELVVCGCAPPDIVANHPSVVVEGFLSKDNPAESERLQQHFATADFFILPTRFEAYGLVFCEAAAYGLPSLATKTGGITSIIQNAQTGFLFEMTDRGDIYAQRIIELTHQSHEYSTMRQSARKRYEELLNWDAFGKQLHELLREGLSHK